MTDAGKAIVEAVIAAHTPSSDELDAMVGHDVRRDASYKMATNLAMPRVARS